MLKDLAGKKTYIVGGLMVLYGLAGLMLGSLEAGKAIEIILEGLGLGALRAGVTKAGAGGL